MPMTSGTERMRVVFEESCAGELLFLSSEAAAVARDVSAGAGRTVRVDGLEVPRSLATRLAAFWGDRVLYWELLLVAEVAGHLIGPLAPEGIEVDFAAACDHLPLDPLLRSEPERDRAVVRERLRGLASDKRLRRRYVRLLVELWSFFEPDWRANRLPLVTRAIEACRSLGVEGAPWPGILKSSAPPSEAWDGAWERAHEDGSAIVGVCAYGGSLVLDLPGTQFFAMSIIERPTVDRERAGELSRRMRAISDPTRLVLLQLLAEAPRTVGELAILLEVSQPTVSNHVKLLREVGLVSPARSGDRRALSLDRGALERLFADVDRLLGR